MDSDHVRIRIGRAWRHNPVYREALVRLSAGAENGLPDAAEAEITDELVVSVAGQDLLAGIREDHVFRAVRDLLRAAERLLHGARKAAVTLGERPVNLLLVRDGGRILITVVHLGPPPRVPVRDLEIGSRAFFEAVRTSVEELLEDLRQVDPALARGPFGVALAAGLRRLRGHARAESEAPETPAPVPPVRPRPIAAGATDGVFCGFELAEGGEQLAAVDDMPEGDLHALLAPGRVHLHGPGGEALAAWTGPPFLALRALVSDVQDLLGAWELGESRGTLRLGDQEVVLDRAAGRIQGPGASVAAAPPAACAAVLRAALDFCAAVVSRAPAQARNPYVADLVAEAEEAAAHCRQFAEGDVTAHREEVPTVRGGAPPSRVASARPLAAWRLRRLTFRTRWTFDAGPLLPGSVGLLGRRLLVAGEDGAFGLDLDSGAPAFAREDVRGLWLGPRRSDPALLATALGLDLLTPGGGTAWSAPPVTPVQPNGDRYLRGAGRILVSLDGRTVVALDEAHGDVLWRFVAPGARACRLAGAGGGTTVASDAGFLYGLDPIDGRVRWRLRSGIAPLSQPVTASGSTLVVGDGADGPAAFLADAGSGREGRGLELPFDGVGRPVPFGGSVLIPGHAGGDAALAVLRRGAVNRRLLPELRGLPSLLPVRGRTYAADAEGRVIAVDGRGRVLWAGRLPAPAKTAGLPSLALARGVLLVAFDGVFALDPDTGEPLGRLEVAGVFGADHLLVDERLNVFLADREGTVHACSVGTHLSLVGD